MTNERTLRKIHVIFKTHLDLGFTLPKAEVMKQCFEDFIPRAIVLAEKLNKAERPMFRWTVGTYLLCEYFRTQPQAACDRLQAALAKGDILWHGLPFTIESELMNEPLLRYSLSMSQRLDAAFHKKTIAAKLSDVPGQTRSIIKPLWEAGIKFLHIGVNLASCLPDVPPVFVWRDPQGYEVIVQYCHGYGDTSAAPACDVGLCICHAEDNSGPPTEMEVYAALNRLRTSYPTAEILVSSMDDYVQDLCVVREKLPVLSAEIGDTWIHGAAADPMLVARYRTLLRLLERPETESEIYNEFKYRLLTIPEHTWALDSKLYLGDYKHWGKKAFQAARNRDRVDEDAYFPKDEYRDAFFFTRQHMPKQQWGRYAYSVYEKELAVNRSLIGYARSALPSQCTVPEEASCVMLAPPTMQKEFTIGQYTLSVLPDGAVSVNHPGCASCEVGHICYEQIGVNTLHAYREQYSIETDETRPWMLGDFYKPGFEMCGAPEENQQESPRLARIGQAGERITTQFFFDPNICRETGCPREGRLQYEVEGDTLWISLSLLEKDAHRMPESLWLMIYGETSPIVLTKAGRDILATDVVPCGNRALHGVDRALWSDWEITPLDTFLLSPGRPRLYDFAPDFSEPTGLCFNLYNNLWSTNYRLWYEEDMHTRFSIKPLV